MLEDTLRRRLVANECGERAVWLIDTWFDSIDGTETIDGETVASCGEHFAALLAITRASAGGASVEFDDDAAEYDLPCRWDYDVDPSRYTAALTQQMGPNSV